MDTVAPIAAASAAAGLVAGFLLRGALTESMPTEARTLKPKSRPFARSEWKLVLCVRQDLGMGKGKIAAQCSHATLGVYKKMAKSGRSAELQEWENASQPKVVVKCKDEEEMNQLEKAARKAGLATYIVCDAGRTQIARGSLTVLAVGPGPVDSVDAVTGHLKLL